MATGRRSGCVEKSNKTKSEHDVANFARSHAARKPEQGTIAGQRAGPGWPLPKSWRPINGTQDGGWSSADRRGCAEALPSLAVCEPLDLMREYEDDFERLIGVELRADL
jgi:hypothetical protein